MGCLNESIFMQDKAPAHKARKTTEWLEERDIVLLDWVSYSPDMNPIENVWAWMKDELYKVKDELNSDLKLKNRIKKLFFSDECEKLIKKLYESMPERIKKVIVNRGG